MVVQGVCKEPTLSVLPLPVIHTNSFLGTKVLAFRSFLQKNQGPIYSDFDFKNSLNQTRWRKEETPHKNSFLPFLLSQTLILVTSNRISKLLRQTRFFLSQLLGAQKFSLNELGFVLENGDFSLLSLQGGKQNHK